MTYFYIFAENLAVTLINYWGFSGYNIREKVCRYNMNFDERVYQVALSMLPGIGPVSAKRLVSYCGSASEVFRQKKNQLLKIPHIGEAIAGALKNKEVLLKAEKELDFAR